MIDEDHAMIQSVMLCIFVLFIAVDGDEDVPRKRSGRSRPSKRPAPYR